MFGVNLILAIAWITLTGEYSFVNVLVGFGLGYAMIWLTSNALPEGDALSRYVHWVRKLVRFLFYVIWTVLVANYRMAKAVLASNEHLSPAIVAVPLDITSDTEITLLANWITLTPGTLTLEVSDDKKQMFIHTIQCDDVEAFRAEIKNKFEQRVHEVFA